MNQQEKAERFTELMTRFTSVLGKILPDDVATRLAELRKEQTSDISRIVYDAMFDDLAAVFAGGIVDIVVVNDLHVETACAFQQFFVGDGFPLVDYC